ncbi:UDP-N-acetylmuramate dehydrogenase [Leucobacter insecticola]|uniref:UDP-N-acetylenolpyruvoylglucosamine reductase n=1 Tax=Leucobacter insecticola TaxID=2714934 RepID=A0A6G8FLU5_9MICO|nr:UDP-N-acetylmuramate dehydrogenase [Leucobacter insecticola]QIM17314.1 UDP-N-acetylmuramate dehydrogenase [Leucobacter insecticola]
MRVGGPAERLLVAHSTEELIAHATALWDDEEPWMLLGGGSNTVVSDEGFPGTALLARNTGAAPVAPAAGEAATPPGFVRLRVQAGHNWDALVAACVDRGWAGIEALSGIPGLAGAAPVQNIGAYGQELSQVLHSIEFLDRDSGAVRRMDAAELELGYRDSILKRGLEGVVLSIDLLLTEAAETTDPTAPVAYAQLANALGVNLGDRVPIRLLRDSVLRLRAAKGMVLDSDDHDSWSSGSFFTNPIVSARFARSLPADAPRFPLHEEEPQPAVTSFEELAAGVPMRLPQPAPEPMVKLSAAWLIEHSGVARGFRLPGSGAAISSKHTLAITNRGGASAAEVAELARFVVERVRQEFGIIMVPEPKLYGLEI